MRIVHFGFRILMAVLMLGLLIFGGMTLYRMGWTQGYMASSLAANSDGQAITPLRFAPPWGFFAPGMFMLPILLVFGLFFMGGMILMPLAMFGRAFRHRDWKMADGPQAEEWARHWGRRHGPWGPWNMHSPDKQADTDPQTTPPGSEA